MGEILRLLMELVWALLKETMNRTKNEGGKKDE